jgi:hypothetical protein
MILSTVVVSLAQPLPNNGPYSSGPSNYPTGPGNVPYPPGPGQGNVPYNNGGQYSNGGQSSNNGGQGPQGEHPQYGPSSEQPQNTPQASTGNMATSLAQGQQLSQQEVANIGGAVSNGASSSGDNSGGSGVKRLLLVGPGSQIQYWALYNGQWTKGPSAVYYNQQMNTLLYNDQGQYLWSYEQYPNGYVDWQNLGYMYQGYYNMWFLGDAKGYHQTAIWGSNSGWSNVLWTYVW